MDDLGVPLFQESSICGWFDGFRVRVLQSLIVFDHDVFLDREGILLWLGTSEDPEVVCPCPA